MAVHVNEMFLKKSARAHTIEVDEETYNAIHKMRVSGESDAEVVRRSFEWLEAMDTISRIQGAAALRINYQEFRRAGVIARQLAEAGYNGHAVCAICNSLLGEWSEDNAYDAFDHLAKGEDSIPAVDLRHAVPLMGEGIWEDKADEMMRHPDVVTDGVVYFRGFCALLEQLRSLDLPDDDLLTPRLDDDNGLMGDFFGSFASGATSLLSAVGTAWTADLPGLAVSEMRQAGVAMSKMREAGYSENMATSLCRAIFCEQSDDEILDAFRFFDLADTGTIDAQEFRAALPLMGESISEERAEQLMNLAGGKQRGKLDLQEFATIIRSVNPKDRPEGYYSVTGKLDEVLVRFNSSWF